MVPCTSVDSHRKRLCFEKFPETPLDYLEYPSMGSHLVYFQAADKQTGKVFSVFMKGTELQRIGISLTTWKKLTISKPEKLPELIENAAKIDWMLGRAATVASEHLSPQFLTFFTDQRTFANRVINSSIYGGDEHSSGIQGVPGMYFHPKGSSVDVFINLKKTPRLGSGALGKVRKVLWLSAPEKSSVLVVKKVFRDKAEESNSSVFESEIRALQNFSNKRGIISLIAGGIYDKKYALFLPIYECNLYEYRCQCPFPLTIGKKLSMISQWLEGLTTISEKGVHGDLSYNNLLLKRGDKGKMEAVIADFDSFRPFGQEEHGLTTLPFGSPEYFAKEIVTPKQDVWAMGICLHGMFAKQWLPCAEFNEEKMALWTASLSPHWILKYPTHRATPQFLLDLIDAMLDPRPDHRPSAKEAFEQFSKGLSS